MNSRVVAGGPVFLADRGTVIATSIAADFMWFACYLRVSNPQRVSNLNSGRASVSAMCICVKSSVCIACPEQNYDVKRYVRIRQRIFLALDGSRHGEQTSQIFFATP